MSFGLESRHLRRATEFVEDDRSAAGVAPLDCESFWALNDRAVRDPFAADCPHLPLGIVISDECVWDELGITPDWHRLLHDDPYHASLCSRYNDVAERVVGRRLVPEHLSGDRDPERPRAKELSDIFEAASEWREASWSYWLRRAVDGPDQLDALLDRVERRLENLREHILPPDWAERKARFTAGGKSLPLYRHQRGPVTFAMSVYGEQELIYLMFDRPELAARFRDLIARAILERARVIDAEAGYSADNAPRGWSWADDNCALLNPELYRFFGYPVLKAVFERYAPDPQDSRTQHSDSEMGHLLPVLAELGLTAVNFGPRLSVAEIRRHMPRAVIHGQLAPFTFSRNDEIAMVAETLRDFEMSREGRGVVFATAGSVNPGSRLKGLRLIMAAIRALCRY